VRFFDEPHTALGVLTYIFMTVERIVSDQERADADVLIAPKVGHIRWDQTRRAGELIEAGYQAGLQAVEEIRKAIDARAVIKMKNFAAPRLT
jgi:predicted acylesterase/phospholipase RssA